MLVNLILSHALSAQRLPRIPSAGGVLEAGASTMVVDGYARSSLSDVVASLWGGNGRMFATASGSLARFESGNTAAYGELEGAAALFSDPNNPSAFVIAGGSGAYRGTMSSSYVAASILLGPHSTGRLSTWLDAGVGRASSSDRYNTSHLRLAGSFVSNLAAISVSAGLVGAGALRYSDATMRARLTPLSRDSHGRQRLVLGLDAGVRGSGSVPGRHAWLTGVVAARIAGPVSVVAYAGEQPYDPERATVGAAFTSIALRLGLGGVSSTTHAPPTPALSSLTRVSRELDDGTRVITVMVSRAQTVELMADFTEWLPVSMTRVGPDIWSVTLAVEQGSHRVEIRTDSGEWRPAPGLPVSSDEFGGSVGVLAVK